MSLIVSLYSRDCIVVGADRRTTITKSNGDIRYSDETCKIFPFTSGICVSYCGDNYVKEDVTVSDFLTNAKRKFSSVSTFDLGTKLLSYFKQRNYNRDIIFQIAGYGMGGLPLVYQVSTKTESVKMIVSKYADYGFACDGMKSIATSILTGCEFADMSTNEAVKLVFTAIQASIESYQYRTPQSVGGYPDVYLITRPMEGWIFNNDIKPIFIERDKHIDDILSKMHFTDLEDEKEEDK